MGEPGAADHGPCGSARGLVAVAAAMGAGRRYRGARSWRLRWAASRTRSGGRRRSLNRPPRDVTRERLVRSEVEDHFERSQRALVELVNADDSGSGAWADDRARRPIWWPPAGLSAVGRGIGDADTRDLLEDVERVLVEVANGSPDSPSNDLTGVRTRIGDQDLIFRLRMATAEMRERERRANHVVRARGNGERDEETEGWDDVGWLPACV